MLTRTHSPSAARRFLVRLPDEVLALASSIQGLASQPDCERYARVLLSRLMILFLLQRHRLLDGDPTYLRRRLQQRQPDLGSDSFFRSLLLPLFHTGLAASELSQATRSLLGTVPCLASGFFAAHDLERQPDRIDLPDAALTRVLDYFELFEWHLDEATSQQALTPALLGCLCEQRGNQKRLGSYYTDSDVTGYIAASTIIPLILDRAARVCPSMFGDAGTIWRLLQQRPDRYIHQDIQRGVRLPLPAEVAAGLDDPARRQHWNWPAAAAYAIPRETWREHILRRARFRALHNDLTTGTIRSANGLISANLDLRCFAQDAIACCDDPGALCAVYQVLERLAILDPTCGAGAFLYAALLVLEPLYTTCLQRLAELLSDTQVMRPDLGATGTSVAEMLGCFHDPARFRASIRRRILQHNLYGVDIMPEAVEICRLRLLLALVSISADQTEHIPLLEQHIRCGDALAGSVTPGPLQTGSAGQASNDTDRALHWPVEFAEVMRRGGFDGVIGNPPYVLARSVSSVAFQGYKTASCGNVYAFVVERALSLLCEGGRCGMVVPIASIATDRMRALQGLYTGKPQWHSHFAVRPAKLFADVDMNLTITLLHKHQATQQVFSSGYRRWSAGAWGERETLFSTLAYQRLPEYSGHASAFPKLGSLIETTILSTMLNSGRVLGEYTTTQGATIYYHSGGRYWRKALPHKLSSHYKPLTVPTELAPIVLALLNSQLFYWYWIVHSNCMDVVAREVLRLPVFPLAVVAPQPFRHICDQLLAAYQRSSTLRKRRGQQIQGDEVHVDVEPAKPILDEIDTLLASAYGFDAEQLDFIVNYDIKYRCAAFDAQLLKAFD